MPFLPAFEKKMSAKLGAMTARKPYWLSAQAACSRERAAAEVLLGDQDLRALVLGLVEDEVGSWLSAWSGVSRS